MLRSPFRAIIKNTEFSSNFELLYSSSYGWLIEACGKLLDFEERVSTKSSTVFLWLLTEAGRNNWMT